MVDEREGRPLEIPFSTDPMRALLDKDDPMLAPKLANMRSGRKAFLRGDPRETCPAEEGWRQEYWMKGWDFAATTKA